MGGRVTDDVNLTLFILWIYRAGDMMHNESRQKVSRLAIIIYTTQYFIDDFRNKKGRLHVSMETAHHY